MSKFLRLPDGSLYEVPDGMSYGAAMQEARQVVPEAFGPTQPTGAAAEQPPETERTWGEAATDVGAGLVKGVGNLAQLPGQLGSLITGDFSDSDTGLQGFGKRLVQKSESFESDALKQRRQSLQEQVRAAEEGGQWEAFKTSFMGVVSDPALLSSFVAEQLPQLIPIIATGGTAAAVQAGRVTATALAQGATREAALKLGQAAAAKAGTTAAIGTGAVMQGTDVGADTYDAIYQNVLQRGGTKEQAATEALNRARAAGASSAALSVLLNRYAPGGKALEEALFGARTGAGMTTGALSTIAKDLPTEVTEEVGGKLFGNIALNDADPTQSLTQGLGETGAQAIIGSGALAGTAGAFSGRGAGAVQAEQREEQRRALEQQRQETAQERQRRLTDPQYILDVGQRYDALIEQRKQLREVVNRKVDGNDLAAQQAKREAQEALRNIDRDPDTQALAREYRANEARIKTLREQAAEQARADKMSPQEYFLDSLGEAPARTPVPKGPATISQEVDDAGFRQPTRASQTPNAAQQAAVYVSQRVQLAQEQQPDPDVGTMAEYIMQDPRRAAEFVASRPNIPGLPVKTQTQLIKRVDAQLQDMQRRAQAAGRQGTQAAQTRLSQVEAEEAAALEADRAEADRLQAEQQASAQRSANLTPEMQALYRMGQRPGPAIPPPGLFASEQPELVRSQAPALGQAAQQLSGETQGLDLQFNEDRNQALGPDAVGRGEPAVTGPAQRAQGGFRLFSAPGEPEADVGFRPLQQRISRLLASPDLTDEGYTFLRQVEDTLPQADRQVEELRSGQTLQGREEDVAALGSLYGALDEQIGAIERGEQGVITEGPPRYTEDAYQSDPGAASTAAMRPAFGTEVQAVLEGRPVKEPVPRGQPDTLDRQDLPQRVVPAAQRINTTAPTTLRGPSTSVRPGDRANNVAERRGGKPLQIPRMLSDRLALYDQSRTDDQAQQLPLFEAEEKKRGAVKPDAAAFKRYMNSPGVRKMQKNLRESAQVLQKRKPIEQMRKQVDVLTKKVEAMRKAAEEYKTERQVLESDRGLMSMQRSVRDLSEALTKRVLDDMQLRTVLNDTTNDVSVLEMATEAERGTPTFKSLRAELEKRRSDLQELQAEHAALQIALKTLDGQIRVARAANRITALRQAAPFPYELAEAETELRAAQAALGEAQAEVSAQERMAKAQDGAARRAAEAVNESTRAKQAKARERAEQKRLEAMHSANVDRRQYDALDESQRAARERLLAGETPEIDVAETAEIAASPRKVLGGYRARMRTLEKEILAGMKRSKTFAGTNLEKLRATHDRLYEQYKKAKTAAQRDEIGAKYDQAAQALREAEQRFKSENVLWPGAKRMLDELDAVTFKAEWLEGAINRGEFEDLAPRAAREVDLSKQRREKLAREAAEARAAAARADAPSTSGEPLTRTEAKQATKAKGTVYKARGGVEAKKMYADYQAAVEATKRTVGSPGRSTQGFAERDTAPLSAAAQEAALDNRLLDVLQDLEQNGSTPFVRSLSAKLRPLVMGVKFRVEPQALVVDGQRLEGEFETGTNTIRMDPDALTEEAVLHEVTHAATLRALMMPEAELTPQQVAAKRELELLYGETRADPEFAQEYARSNLAEFVSEVLSNGAVRAKLDARKPTLLGRMYQAMLRLIGITPETSRSERARLAAEALFMPSKAFVMVDQKSVASVMRGVFPDASIKAAAGTPDPIAQGVSAVVGRGEQSWWQKVMANTAGLAARTQFLDSYAPVEQLTQMGVERGQLEPLRAFQTMYYLRFGQQRNQFLSQAATRGVPQLTKAADGTFTYESTEGPNLAQISQILSDAGLKDPQQAEGEFTAFLAIRRAMQIPGGFEKLNLKEPMTRAQAQAFMDSVAADPKRKAAYEQAAQVYRQYNNKLLDLLVQTGAMSREKANDLKQGDYVPFYRTTADGVVELVISGERPVRIGDIASQPYLKEMVGDDQKILPLFASAMQNTSMLLDMALRNQAVKDTAYTMRDMEVGKIGTGTGPTGARSKRNVLHFKDRGKDMFLIMDQEALDLYGIPADLLVKGMEGIKTTLPWVVKAMSYPANWLRTGVTRMPTYAVRQIVRDSLNAVLVTGGDFTPLTSSLSQLAKMQTGSSDAAQLLERAGAISTNVFTGDKTDWNRTLRDISSGKNVWNTAMSKLDAFATQGDTATRAVLYEMYRKRGMSHMEAVLGTLESMNFSRRGVSPTMHFLSTMIPFFNAQIQGMDVIYRAARGRSLFENEMQARAKLLSRGALMMAGTLLYAASMQDDEAYQNATPQERALNWFVRIPGLDEPLRVPIPFELGYAFKALPEMIFNAASSDQDASDVTKAMGQLIYGSIPLGIPQALKPGIEVAANYSFYSGRNIVSQREQALDPEAQVRQNTTALAQMLGTAANVSPLQIDYLIRGYFGGLGALMAQVPNIVFRPGAPDGNIERAERKLSETPLIGTLFQPNDGRGILDEAYTLAQDMERRARTYKALVEQGRRSEAAAYAQRYANEIALASQAGRFRQQMGEFAKYRRMLQAAPLSASEKRERLDALRQIELAYAEQLRALGKPTSQAGPRE